MNFYCGNTECGDQYDADETTGNSGFCSYECEDRAAELEFLEYHGETAFPFTVTGDPTDPFDGMLCTAPDIYETKAA